jgi:diguanylate cyclase (GGDEF)-like protein
MLKTFNAALSRLWEKRSLDSLADVAEAFLDAAVMMIVMRPAPVVLGAGRRARAAGLVSAEQATALTAMFASGDASRPNDPAAPMPAVPSGLAPPLGDLVGARFETGGRTGALLVFPSTAVPAGPFAAVAEAAERAFAEVASADRDRAELVRLIQMFDTVERAARIGVWELDVGRETLFWSDEVFRIHAVTNGRAPAPADALAFYPEPGRSRLADAVKRTETTGTPTDLTLPFTTACGERRVVRVIAIRHIPPEGGLRICGVFQDVTREEEATQRLWWTANHDALTGLPNRALFGDRFRTAMQRRAGTSRELAFLLVDVDRFKLVNDTLGHAAGDELLKLVAAHLRAAVRPGDTVARTGGDEFSILLDDVCHETNLPGLLRRITAALTIRLVWGEQTMIVTMSAGAAIAPVHATAERELVAAADVALYRAKDMSNGSLVTFEPSFGDEMQKRAHLLADVRQALSEGRIVPWYQPQIDVVSGRIVGVEALARWIADDRVRTAADFVSAMSDHEIGARIGAAVVDRAIAEIAALNVPRRSKIALAVNASAGELARARFLEQIGQEAARGSGGGPITVEITEDVILEDPDGLLAERLQAASAAGVRFSLDDVGSEDGSLLRVSTLPISEVKIDRRIVAGLRSDPDRQKVVRGIIDVARALDLRVIVEGVETEAEVDDIVALGGRYLQGFYYSRAVPLHELQRLLADEEARLDAAA